jgi:hypothetical protein
MVPSAARSQLYEAMPASSVQLLASMHNGPGAFRSRVSGTAIIEGTEVSGRQSPAKDAAKKSAISSLRIAIAASRFRVNGPMPQLMLETIATSSTTIPLLCMRPKSWYGVESATSRLAYEDLPR